MTKWVLRPHRSVGKACHQGCANLLHPLILDGVDIGRERRGGAVDSIAGRQHKDIANGHVGFNAGQANVLVRRDLSPRGATKWEPVVVVETSREWLRKEVGGGARQTYVK